MHPLAHLAIIWAAVFVAVVAAKRTRLTPVLFFLFMGFLLVAVPLTIRWWRPYYHAAAASIEPL